MSVLLVLHRQVGATKPVEGSEDSAVKRAEQTRRQSVSRRVGGETGWGSDWQD